LHAPLPHHHLIGMDQMVDRSDSDVSHRRQAAKAPGTVRWDLGLTGLSCAACVRRAERAATAVPGVQAAAVNLATEQAAVTAGPGVRLADVAQALASAGYPIVEDSFDLAVSGMSCASCSGRVERALLAVPGVLAATVNLATQQARVRVASGVASVGELAAAIRSAGYDVPAPPPSGQSPATQSMAPRDREGLAAAVACGLALPLLLPMLAMPFGWHAALPGWAQLVLAGVVQAGFGRRFYRGAWHALRARAGNQQF